MEHAFEVLYHLMMQQNDHAIHQQSDSTVILESSVEIPIKEKWLFENASALQKVQIGLLAQAKNKELIDRGSFSQS